MSTKTALTWEEFLAAGTSDQRWEYIDGEIRFMSPTGYEHGIFVRKISALLDAWEKNHPDWSTVGPDVSFTMADSSWLGPDGAATRVERLGPEVPREPVPFPPDIAFEVVSPNDRQNDIRDKQAKYTANRVIQVWVHPVNRTVAVHVPDHPIRYFLEGEPVIIEEMPGLEMNLFPLR